MEPGAVFHSKHFRNKFCKSLRDALNIIPSQYSIFCVAFKQCTLKKHKHIGSSKKSSGSVYIFLSCSCGKTLKALKMCLNFSSSSAKMSNVELGRRKILPSRDGGGIGG